MLYDDRLLDRGTTLAPTPKLGCPLLIMRAEGCWRGHTGNFLELQGIDNLFLGSLLSSRGSPEIQTQVTDWRVRSNTGEPQGTTESVGE